MAEANHARRAVLSAGIAVTLGRWPLHWRHQLWWAVIGAAVVLALVAGLWSAHRIAALRMTAAFCAVDAIGVLRAWSAHVPLHCDCVRRAGTPALAGWGGAVIAADVALCALSVWLARPVSQTAG